MKNIKLFLVILLATLCSNARALEAYAEFSSNDGTLTFYYDNNRGTRTGTIYSLPWTAGQHPGWYENYASINTVTFDASFAGYHELTSTSRMFDGLINLTTINNLNWLKTNNVTDMSYMFNGCQSLTSLDLQYLITYYVTNMECMFAGCYLLRNVNIENFFQTPNVTNVSGMFMDCSSLTTLDLSYLNTSNVTTMLNMFRSCNALVSVNLSSFNTEKVTTMAFMFGGCNSLKKLDLSGFNTSEVTTMKNMFESCRMLTTLDLTTFDTGKVNNMYSMFSNCVSLTELDLSDFNTSNVTNMGYMFQACTDLQTIYANTAWACNNSTDMFRGCINLVSANLSYDADKTDVTYANPTTGYFTRMEWSVTMHSCEGGRIQAEYTKVSDGSIAESAVAANSLQIVGIKARTPITFTLWPGDGYEISSVFCGKQLSVGEGADVTPIGNGKYQYLLPASKIVSGQTTVIASYQRTSSASSGESFVWENTQEGDFYNELSTYSEDRLKGICKLTISGPINSADLFIIRKLCGDLNNDPYGYAGYGLEMLDMTNTTIVADNGTGTVPYLGTSYITTNDELPENMFASCVNLDELKLPINVGFGYNSSNIFVNTKTDMTVHAPWATPLAMLILPTSDPLCLAFGNKSTSPVKDMTLIVPKGSLEAYQTADGWNWFKEIREETEEQGGGDSTDLRGDIDGDGSVSLADVTALVNIVLKKK